MNVMMILIASSLVFANGEKRLEKERFATREINYYTAGEGGAITAEEEKVMIMEEIVRYRKMEESLDEVIELQDKLDSILETIQYFASDRKISFAESLSMNTLINERTELERNMQNFYPEFEGENIHQLTYDSIREDLEFWEEQLEKLEDWEKKNEEEDDEQTDRGEFNYDRSYRDDRRDWERSRKEDEEERELYR